MNITTKTLLVISTIIAFFFLLPEPVKNDKQAEVKSTQKESLDSNFNHDFIIQNVRLYDGDELFEKVDVLIKNNRISKIEPQLPIQSKLPVFNGMGKTLLPGLIDSHTHAFQDALKEALNFGVTTELDMFTMPDFFKPHLIQREQLTNVNQSDLFTASILATTQGGHGTEYGFKIPVINSVANVEQFVIDRIEEGADYIKAVYNAKEASRQHFPSISKEILRELVIQSHNNHLMLVVHVDNLISAKHAIKLGANGIVHSFLDKVVDQDFINLMINNNAFIIPTLSVQSSLTKNSKGSDLLQQSTLKNYLTQQQKNQLKASFPDFGIPASALQNALDSVKLLSDANVTILAGSDAPNPGTSHGVSIHGELELLVNAGLSREQALHSATGAVRKYFPVGLRGTLKINAPASMILVNGNPFNDISQTQNISHIWKNGTSFTRKTFENKINNNKKIKTGLITDFSHSISKTENGGSITQTTDQYAGGKSEVKLSLINDIKTSNQSLLIKGEINKGFMFPWSGVSYLPTKNMNLGIDLSNIKSFSFDAKTALNANNISVLLFQKGSFQPKAIKVSLTENWKMYTISLKDFTPERQEPHGLSDVTNISIAVQQSIGPFEFLIDNLKFE